MKHAFRILVVLTVGGLVAGLFGQTSNDPTRVPRGYVHIRPSGVSANDTALTVSTSSWHDVSGWQSIPQDWDSMSISFFAYGDGTGIGNPYGGSVTAKVYVVHEYGSAIPVVDVSLHVGNLELSHDPAYGPGSQYRASQVADPNHKWVDGPITVNQRMWRSPVEVTGISDGIGEINFNHAGATSIKVLFSSKTDITTIYAVMTGRKQ